MNSTTRPRALVIGGSLGGLFAATSLRAIGWDVGVFDMAAGFDVFCFTLQVAR